MEFQRQPTEESLYLHSNMVPKANLIKYFDVTLNPKLSWNKHVGSVTTKENPTLGFI